MTPTANPDWARARHHSLWSAAPGPTAPFPALPRRSARGRPGPTLWLQGDGWRPSGAVLGARRPSPRLRAVRLQDGALGGGRASGPCFKPQFAAFRRMEQPSRGTGTSLAPSPPGKPALPGRRGRWAGRRHDVRSKPRPLKAVYNALHSLLFQ